MLRMWVSSFTANCFCLTAFKMGDWWDDECKYQSFGVHLLRLGLPPASPDEFLEDSMCIPIFPNTDHPTREPLKLDKPLPWTNCYHSSFEQVQVRILKAFANDDQATRITWDAFGRHMMVFMQDSQRRKTLEKTAHPLSPQPALPDSERPLPVTDEPVTLRRSTSTQISSGSEDDESEELPHKPPTPPIAVMSYDLSVLEAPSNPEDLFAEIKLIKQYV